MLATPDVPWASDAIESVFTQESRSPPTTFLTAPSFGKRRLTVVLTDEASDPWAALADGTRRTIFKRLAAGPMAVGELAHGMPVSRPAVSQHLKVLKCAGLVADRPVGTRRVYQVDPKGVEALRSELDVFWGNALDAYKLLADEGEEVR